MAHIPRKPSSIAVILYDEARAYAAEADMPSPLQHGTASKILCVGAGNEAICRVVHSRNLPAIMLGHTSRMPGVTSIVPDYPAAAGLALELLFRHGHRHIGIVSGPFGSHDPRLAEMNVAIGDAAARLGIRIAAEDVFSGNLDFEAGITAVKHLRERADPPTALLCLAESAAAGAVVAAHARGMWVPGQLSIVTFADHAGAIESSVPMSAVVLPVDELAAAAVKEADRQIRAGIPAEPPKITIGVRLIERETCGPIAA
jgi:LacI family transcriptional regulator